MYFRDFLFCIFFFFNDTATTEIYTLSLHDALPIYSGAEKLRERSNSGGGATLAGATPDGSRSEEHTSELQSQSNLVCRLLLEKKKMTSVTATAVPALCLSPLPRNHCH